MKCNAEIKPPFYTNIQKSVHSYLSQNTHMKIPEYKKKLMQMQTKSQRVLKKFRSDLPDLNQTRQKKHLLIWILFADQIIIIIKKI